MARKKIETDHQYIGNLNNQDYYHLNMYHWYYNDKRHVGKKYSTVPSIAANTRYVHEVRFENLGWIDRAFVTFNFGTEAENDADRNYKYFLGNSNDTGSGNGATTYIMNDTLQYNSILVYKDHRYTSRMIGANSKFEFASGSGTMRTYGYGSYSTMSDNILVGYYNTAGTVHGAFFTGTNIRTVIQNMWFEQDGSDLILKMAFKNEESAAASNAKGFTSYIILV